MPRVIISYNQENMTKVEQLADVLRINGIDVWLAPDKITFGLYTWKNIIRQGIIQGDFFIACFSREYIEGSRLYLNKELTLAVDKLRQWPTERTWFIPVLLSETGIPDWNIGAGDTLHSLQCVPLYQYQYWDSGVASILSVIHPNSAKPLHDLIQATESSSASLRIQAIDSVEVLGPLAKEAAVPHLLKLLQDHNYTVGATAAKALSQIGVATEEIVAELLTLMRNAEVYYDSRQAALTLSKIRPQGIFALLEATTFTGYGVDYDAFSNLIEMGKAVIPQLEHIVESAHKHADVAIEVLRRIHDPAALPDLVRILANRDSTLRSAAAAAIGEVFICGGAAHTTGVQSAIFALIEALENPAVKSTAIVALGRAGRNAKVAVSCLIEALNDKDICTFAIEALGRIGEDAVDAVPTLIAAVATKDTRSVAIRALGQIGLPSAIAIPTFITAMNDSDSEVRLHAVEALGRMGPAARDAVSYLVTALDDPDSHVRWEAAEALGAIGKSAIDAVPKMLQALEHSEDWAYRWRIAEALGKIGDQQAVESLIKALSYRQNEIQYSAAHALGRIGNRSAISSLLKVSFDKDFSVRWAVIKALGDLGTPMDTVVVNRLIAILEEDSNIGARRMAAQSLAKVGDRTTIPALKKALNDPNDLVRSEALAAIDQLEKA